MRVALIAEYFPPFSPGGAELSVRLLAQELAAHPVISRIVVITPNYGAAAFEDVSADAGVEAEGTLLVERFPFPFKLHNRRLHAYGLLANPLYYAYSAWQISRLARKHQLDILHVQNKQSVVGAVWAARWCRIPVVVTVRDVMLLCRFGMCLNHYNEQPRGCDGQTYRQCLRDYTALYMPKMGVLRRTIFAVMARYHRLDSKLKGSMMRRADAVVTISDRLGEILRARRVTPPCMVTIYNAMPQPPSHVVIPHDNAAWKIFFAGRLSWGKGAHLLLEAMAEVSAALAPKPVQLMLAGAGPLHQQLETRAAALGLAESVTLLGTVPQAEMQKWYARADVVVVPSVVQEGFGRVALEALVAGTPVVASTHGGLPEIVEDGVTGYVVDPEPVLLAEAIVKVLQQAVQFRRRVAEALPTLQVKFGSDVATRHVELYTSLRQALLPQEEKHGDR